MRSALHSKFKDAAERLMPVLKESGFAERGVSHCGTKKAPDRK